MSELRGLYRRESGTYSPAAVAADKLLTQKRAWKAAEAAISQRHIMRISSRYRCDTPDCDKGHHEPHLGYTGRLNSWHVIERVRIYIDWTKFFVYILIRIRIWKTDDWMRFRNKEKRGEIRSVWGFFQLAGERERESILPSARRLRIN